MKLNYAAYDVALLDDTCLCSWQRNTLYNSGITHVLVQCRPDLQIVKLLVTSYEIVFLAVWETYNEFVDSFFDSVYDNL